MVKPANWVRQFSNPPQKPHIRNQDPSKRGNTKKIFFEWPNQAGVKCGQQVIGVSVKPHCPLKMTNLLSKADPIGPKNAHLTARYEYYIHFITVFHLQIATQLVQLGLFRTLFGFKPRYVHLGKVIWKFLFVVFNLWSLTSNIPEAHEVSYI